jgi:hypothetical protein
MLEVLDGEADLSRVLELSESITVGKVLLRQIVDGQLEIVAKQSSPASVGPRARVAEESGPLAMLAE